jgi:hypothetical protein
VTSLVLRQIMLLRNSALAIKDGAKGERIHLRHFRVEMTQYNSLTISCRRLYCITNVAVISPEQPGGLKACLVVT